MNLFSNIIDELKLLFGSSLKKMLVIFWFFSFSVTVIESRPDLRSQYLCVFSLYSWDDVEGTLFIGFAANILALGQTILFGSGQAVGIARCLTPVFTIGHRSQKVRILSCSFGITRLLFFLSWNHRRLSGNVFRSGRKGGVGSENCRDSHGSHYAQVHRGGIEKLTPGILDLGIRGVQ